MKVLIKVVNDIRAKEWKFIHRENLKQSLGKMLQPKHHHQKDTNPLIHDGQIMQWLTNGHMVITCHEHQKEDLNTPK